MVYNWVYTRKSAPLSDEDRLERAIGNGPEHVDQTTFRSKANRDNAYLVDRAAQKTETFTGIDGINVQDRAIQESMGPICDRRHEHLGPADKGIIQMRRLLRDAVSTVRAGGHSGRCRGELLQSLLRTAGIAARRRLAPDSCARYCAGKDIADGVRIRKASAGEAFKCCARPRISTTQPGRSRLYCGLRGKGMNPSRFGMFTFGSDCASSISPVPMIPLRLRT
jgi:LigXa C-terminal domain like